MGGEGADVATSIYPNAAGAGWIGFKLAVIRIPLFWPAIGHSCISPMQPAGAVVRDMPTPAKRLDLPRYSSCVSSGQRDKTSGP